jgi:hypothetical protein
MAPGKTALIMLALFHPLTVRKREIPSSEQSAE